MSRFYEEIVQIPEALHRAVDYYRSEGLKKFLDWQKLASEHSALSFLGMGTSEFSH